MRLLRKAALVRLAVTLGLVVTLAACGSGDSGSGDSGSKAAPSTSGLPTGSGDAEGLVAQVASFDLAVGPPGRVIVGVLTGDQRLVAFATVGFNFSYLGTKEDRADPRPGPTVVASYLPVPGTTVPDPAPSTPQVVTGSQSRGLYAAQVGFDQAGFWQVEVVARVEGKERKAVAAFPVNAGHAVPFVGDPAPHTENLTTASTDAPRAAIDSRAGREGAAIPDAQLHATTVAAALDAHRPVVVVIATPVYCTSRFCGPVTDMVAELATTYADRADFVHIEVWRDFQEQVINKAAADWILRSGGANEPWVFLVGADGRIAARLDNVATKGEIEPMLQALPVIGRSS